MTRSLAFSAFVLASLTLTAPAHAAEQDAIDGCIDMLRETRGPIGGEVLNSSFSEAATEVILKAADDTYWRCLAYSDGTVGEMTQVTEDVIADIPDPYTPIRVAFEPGSSGASYDVTMEPGGVTQYLLSAGQGQTLSMTIEAGGANMYYQVIAPDDARLVGGTDVSEPFSSTLPASGDYTVEIISNAGDPVDYIVNFEID